MSRDRDRILEQALKHELRAAGTSPARAGCLDAETLAAWIDEGLDGQAAAATEAHVSNCARCQSLAATFARSVPVVEPTAAPEARPFPLWKWWLAPIAAGVTAVTLWTIVPEGGPQMRVAPPKEQQSSATAVASVEPAAPGVAAPSVPPPARADVDRFSDRASSTLARENRSEPAVVAESKKEAAADIQERIAVADARTGVAASAAQQAAAPPAPPSPAAPPPPAAVALEAPAAIRGLQKSAVAAAIEVPSIQASRKWRIAGNRIERTDDGGATWSVQRQMPDEAIIAGSAPAVPVAWFVGRAGLVLLTTDSGVTFADVSLAEPLDLASVSATDARSASIFSVSGRRFRTGDGGRTWQPF